MILIRNNVERDVPEWDVGRFLKEGYRPLGGPAPVAPAQQDEEACPSEGSGEKAETPLPDAAKEPGEEGADAGEARSGNTGSGMTKKELGTKTVKELRAIAKDAGVWGYSNMDKSTLIAVLLSR